MCLLGLQRAPERQSCDKPKSKAKLASEDPEDDPYEKVPDISHLMSSSILNITGFHKRPIIDQSLMSSRKYWRASSHEDLTNFGA
jgi:uncharacterized membrane protein